MPKPFKRMLLATLLLLPSTFGEWMGSGPAHAAQPTTTEVLRQTIYHSPQAKGYTSWCTLWRAKDGGLRVAFQQVTGPVEDPAQRKNVTVILSSADDGATWKPLREVIARTNELTVANAGIYAAPASSSFCGHGWVVLPDGTLVTGLWATADGKSGFIQRSTDDGLTWSPPIYLLDPEQFKTYPTQIHRLHDGRLLLVAGVVKRSDIKTTHWLLKEFFESRDEGKTWSHLWTMPPEVGMCEESDFVELDNGDVLWVHRAEHYDGNKYLHADRLQNTFRRKGQMWDIGPVQKLPIPHSGFPELLKTREGAILHIATDGVWQTTDEGKTWAKVAGLPGSPYYPRAIQLPDDRILIVGHVGSDNRYGSIDQSIVQQILPWPLLNPLKKP